VVSVNLASNEITNEGMADIFRNLENNESVIDINVSTMDGMSRNRIGLSGIYTLKSFLT
jgi:hypothetical protein